MAEELGVIGAAASAEGGAGLMEELATLLELILEYSWNEIFIFDAETLRFISASAGACQNLGYSLDELRQLTPLDLKPDYTGDQFYALMEPLRRGEKATVAFVTMHQRKDGTRYPAQVRLQICNLGLAPAFIAIIQDITEQERYIAELERKVLYDALTDLPNRSLLQDRLEHALKVADRESAPLAVLIVDVMRLKEVNDTLGYRVGDFVLKETAARLTNALREYDTVARLGGDEFAILLPTVNIEHVPLVAEKIQKQFEQPMVVENIQLEIEVAIGIALYPEHGDSTQVLFQSADIAMRLAKCDAIGFGVYQPEEHPYSLRRLKLNGELREAIKEKRLSLHYQPKIDIRTGKITSVEALARWPYPAEGMIPPSEFIPLVEQSGLVRPFTLWVLEEAIEQIKYWSENGIDLAVAVNLSTRNLLDNGLPDRIAQMLEAYNVSPTKLALEVTESAVMSRTENSLRILSQLNEMGIRLSIDDFGTGFSSLSYLKKLPIHEVKIDQSFVRSIATNQSDAIIVRSTIDLAHNMGLHAVAEGVENQAILDLLKILGCDIAQGYHISHPLPAGELTDWLRAASRS